MSLYLKYRPRDFESLVWQDFIKNTLSEAINKDKTVWAYLFCWPRWTGKTSSARIFAKAINCLNPKNGNPCNNCEICNAINDENLVDVIEIDAASFTWVDNIRAIIEKAQFRPAHAKYKVYIIDEVHMLSKWAFNALLKILEEPPSYVKFILATTETNKVLDTIISRCQRYDFKRITKEDIKSRLTYVAKKEDIKIDEKSLDYIANSSAWWLRNALSLFEQFINDWEIRFDFLSSVLWLVSDDILKNFLEKLTKKDTSIIDDLEEISSSGKDLKIFFKELIFKTKNIAIEELKKWKDIKIYIDILDILDSYYAKTKNSLDENTTFLIAILKILEWDFTNTDINKKEEKSILVSQEKSKLKEIEKEEIVQNNKGETIENIEKKQEINHDDILDVFSSNDSQAEKETSHFDKDIFIEKAKWNWISSWAKMSLVWAIFRLEENNLIITCKTDFTKKSLNVPSIITLLNQTLVDLWFVDCTIILK